MKLPIISTSKRPLRRSIQFYLLGGVMTFFTIWVFATSWIATQAEENENWFHEILLFLLMVTAWVWGYFNLYRQSSAYQAIVQKKKAEEAAAAALKKQKELEAKQKKFEQSLERFTKAQTYTEKKDGMAGLLEVGLESPKMRQKVINILAPLNEWMRENDLFLQGQNLLSWRMKNNHFEVSSRFREGSESQDLSIKSINVMEAISKRHLQDFQAGKVDFVLDLSGKIIPSITLSGMEVAGEAIRLEKTVLWQASFAESSLTNLSLAGCQLQGASFWKANLHDVDLAESQLMNVKFRTNLQEVRNLSKEQFFMTKEWELCFLSKAQEGAFFPGEGQSSQEKDRWKAGSEKRQKLYFGVSQI